MRAFLAMPLAAAIAGCASIPSYSFDQWRAAQNRHFSRTTPKQFEAALSAVFEASFPHKYQLRPVAGGATAERTWVLFAIGYARGIEHWQINYAANGDGVDANADLENIPANLILPDPVDIQRPDSVATYELLWSRMSYVLDQRQDWQSCEAYEVPLRHRSLDPYQEWGLCGDGHDAAVPQRLAGLH